MSEMGHDGEEPDETTRKKMMREDGRCFLKDLGIFFFFEQTRNFASWTTDFLVEQLVNCYWFVWLVVSFCVICLLFFYGIG